MKVALVGSAPSSMRAAPFQNPEWKIYGCSPGLYGFVPRVDEWFELHLWEPGQTWFSPEYVQWLKDLPQRGAILWTGAPNPEGPVYGKSPVEGAKVLPWKEMLAEFDPHAYFCSSSLFWMMARAIQAGATTIGLWGVDMAAGEEYEMQRAGIHYMSYIARSRGIEVGIPEESDLFTPRFRYGIDEWTHGFRKWRARRQEMLGRRAQAEAQMRECEKGLHFLNGAVEDLDWCHNTWFDKHSHTGPTQAPVAFNPGPFALTDLTDVPAG